jgi:[acyl-carrier-protein] S-malonyltransferase
MNKFAVIFPGQGSQSVGMLAAMAQQEIVRQTFVEASRVLGYDVWELVQQGPEEKLNQTEYTQPALLAADIAVWRYWRTTQPDLTPAFLAGHSLGEYAALVAAEALTFADAVQLVAKRGRYMQNAVASGIGAMAAIVGLEESKIKQLCEESKQKDEILSPANFNSIGQTVIAGHRAAVLRAIELAQAQGAKMAKLIPVSVPSHCALMESAALHLAQDLADTEIHRPHISVIHNSDVSSHSDPEAIRLALTHQLTHPVRWVETIQFFEANGVLTLFECGPGKVLTGLNKRITSALTTRPIPDLLTLDQ